MTPVEAKGYMPYTTTDRQKEILTKIIECGTPAKAAREIGIKRQTVDEHLMRIKRNAAKRGYAPDHNMTQTSPEGFCVKGVSTLYDMDGEVKAQWVKTNVDPEEQKRMLEEAVSAFYEDLPAIKKKPAPKNYDTDIIPWFQIGDAHLGMLAHEAETGQNFDLKIATRELLSAMTSLIDNSEPRERCVINDLGDGTHYENYSAVTEASGHRLDHDGRYPKMIRAYSQVMRAIVDKALEKFKHVDIIINQGNHSRTNDIWMAELLRVAYREESRLTVLDNSNVFIPYRMGNTFVMVHHSDKCKPVQLAKVMATDFHQDWGESRHRYIDIGHIHHQMVVKEHPGVVIESWNQLAAQDKYAHDGGWRSRQCLTRVDRSRTYGEKGRETITAHEVRDNLSIAYKDRRDVYRA